MTEIPSDIVTRLGFSPGSSFGEFGEYRPYLGSTRGVRTKFGEFLGSTDQIWGVQTKFEVYADNITKICCKIVIYHVLD